MSPMTRFRNEQEEGVALITALLAVVILSGMALVFFNRAVTESFASGFSRDHETVLHAAEAASDNQIALMNADNDHVTVDRDGNPIQFNGATVTDEESWALALLDDIRPSGGLTGSDAWITTEAGEAYAVRPLDTLTSEPMKVIYSVGAVPSFEAENPRIRVLKLQIDQDRFVPNFALLTDGNLDFGGNAAIVAPGCDSSTPTKASLTCIADVHTNGGFSNSGSASTIQGQVSQATGSCPSSVTAVNGCVDTDDGVAKKAVPAFKARDFYNRTDKMNPDGGGQETQWFDLCPPGKPAAGATVREPSASGPCTGGSVQVWPDPATPSSDFRGWKWQAGQWSGSSIGSGAFYVYHADAKVTGTSGVGRRAVSIFAEQDPANKGNSGSIDISGNPLMESAVESVLMIADGDLDMQGKASSGSCGETPGAFSGFIGVREQLKTQGTVELRGSIVVRDVAEDHGLVKRNTQGISGTMCLEFDPNLAMDFTGLWVITYWNEL
jgi:hypothetical protein